MFGCCIAGLPSTEQIIEFSTVSEEQDPVAVQTTEVQIIMTCLCHMTTTYIDITDKNLR